MTHKQQRWRGFGSIDKAVQREVAGRGGKIAHQLGRAHIWTKEEARTAGRKGGQGKKGRHYPISPAVWERARLAHDLYYQQQQSIAVISQRLQTTTQTVYRYLRLAACPGRRNSEPSA